MFKFSKPQESAFAAPSAVRLPRGILEYDDQIMDAPPDLVALAMDGWTLKQRIDALEKELKQITDKLSLQLAPGTKLAVDGVTSVSVAAHETFKLENVTACQKILEGRFDDLVDATTQYKLTDKLKDMILDPDHPLSDSLRACFSIKNGVMVTFRPGKAL